MFGPMHRFATHPYAFLAVVMPAAWYLGLVPDAILPDRVTVVAKVIQLSMVIYMCDVLNCGYILSFAICVAAMNYDVLPELFSDVFTVLCGILHGVVDQIVGQFYQDVAVLFGPADIPGLDVDSGEKDTIVDGFVLVHKENSMGPGEDDDFVHVEEEDHLEPVEDNDFVIVNDVVE